ncbi:hypothetical protein BD410DRAFT_897428 [Rickenella mellea]|uniref:Uncharacterized protein n=1 Tax=Rickenella mellea TaxID=50990 RepID=A0A4Y7Q848_9AGAM|nr:hypothetical protein BD410DRAFT_897428 [Rickenella mellea]
MSFNAALHTEDYWCKLAKASMENDMKLYGLKMYDFETPIPQNAGSISRSFTVTDPIHESTCQVMARVTPAENGNIGYVLDFIYDGSSVCGNDGELVDTLDYFQVFDMYGRQLLPTADFFREVFNIDVIGKGRAADLAGIPASEIPSTCKKQVYLLSPLGYYEIAVGEHCKRILFDPFVKNSFDKRLPRALFVVEADSLSAGQLSPPSSPMLNQALARLEI